MNTEIYIATHKDYNFPQIESYIPIHVGKDLTDLSLGIIGDNTGENISNLNPNFCELTALYWMWKNSSADILGLVHYRRYFSDPDIDQEILKIKNINKDLIYLIKPEKMFIKRLKVNFSTTVEKQYKFWHYSKDWDELKSIILNKYPDYISDFDYIGNGKELSCYNMFIGNREFVNEYCNWLFSILFEMSSTKDLSSYDKQQARIYGFLSERLLNVYLHHNRDKYKVKYLNKINF